MKKPAPAKDAGQVLRFGAIRLDGGCMATRPVRSIAHAVRLSVQRKRLQDGLAAIQLAFVCFLPGLFRSGRKRVDRRIRIPLASEAFGRVARREKPLVAADHAGPVQG